MKKSRRLLNIHDQHSKKLKLAKMQGKQLRVFGTISSNSQSLSLNEGGGKSKNTKGGVVVKGQTIVLKTNYEVAGKMKQDGTRATRKQVGSHASASLDYMNNHGAEDIKDQELSNIYDENGERLNNEELRELKKLAEAGEEFQAMRRIMIDPGQKDYLLREDMKELVTDSMNEFMRKTDKEFDFKFAIHTDKIEFDGNIHAHVLATGTARDININKEQLQILKETIADKEREILHSKELEKDRSIDKLVEKEIQLDKEKELQNLEEKFRDEGLDKAIKQVYKQSYTNNQELKL